MRFATTVTLLSAVILGGSSVLAIPVPATEAISNDLTSLAARELSYESSVEARAFGLEERGLRAVLSKWQKSLVGPSKKELAEQERRAFDFDALLEERGLGSGLRKLRKKVAGGGSSAAPAELERRQLENELLERGEGKSSTPPRKGGGVSSIYGSRSLSAADLRRRDLRTLRNLSLRRRELEGEIRERAPKRTHAGTY
ncbi:hypothetical protein DFP72DRAFT_1178536 [Ephemerocybe angulata]|uniref:Uncharacterized protein n=1 Tax=Ephemerocybe angulata TaxID=980116 RepID=A0A8H6HBK8_9AGAR|nr:hypothetical protein DFP72DRAFT_1178536 [Tulosesus angulatus]